MARKEPQNYLRELLRNADDAYANSTDDEQAAKSIPLIIGAIRNLVAVAERMGDDVAALNAQVTELEALRAKETKTDDTPTLDAESLSEQPPRRTRPPLPT